MGRRAEFTRRVKLDAWSRAKGCCEGCGRKLFPGDRIEYDHIVACDHGGDNSLANCQVLGRCCHKPKTVQDAKISAKSRSVRAKHVGAAKAKRPVPGSKASKWKRAYNRDTGRFETVRRTT